jgi:hypothetical protein
MNVPVDEIKSIVIREMENVLRFSVMNFVLGTNPKIVIKTAIKMAKIVNTKKKKVINV